jgi:hypothetical protein
VVDVGYEGKVIQAIVNYIYTDEVPANTSVDDENDASEDACNLELMRFLVALIDASEFFALSTLRRMIETSTKALMLKFHKFATFFMAACAPDSDATKSLRDTALVLVKNNPSLLIDETKSVLELIHPLYIEEILEQERLPMNELSCFQILQAWSSAEVQRPDDDKNVSITASTEAIDDWEKNREHIASEMTRHIDLENIRPMELATVVTYSGLVSAEQLFSAYQTQALRYDESESQMRTC